MNAHFEIEGATDIPGVANMDAQKTWHASAIIAVAGLLTFACIASLGWSVAWRIRFAGGLS